MTTRADPSPYADRVTDQQSRGGQAKSAALAWPVWTPWIVAFVVFVVAIQTAPSVLDVHAVEGGLLPLVAAAAAVPLGLIRTRPWLGWALSAGSAFAVSQIFPVIDGDPWPWPVVHGLVLLTLLFAVSAWSTTHRGRARFVAVAVAWLGTVALFWVSMAVNLRGGWTVLITAIAAAGLTARWLLPPSSAEDAHPTLPADWRERLTHGFHEAFVGIVPSPPVVPTRRPGRLRRFPPVVPWVMAAAMFWIAAASIQETRPLGGLTPYVVATVITVPLGLIRTHALVGWRIVTAAAVVLFVLTVAAGDVGPGVWPITLHLVWLATLAVVSVRHDRWTLAWVWTTMTLAGIAMLPFDRGQSIVLIVVSTALVFIGDLIRTRRQVTSALAEQTERSEREQARRTVLEERARIARDLHDIVAHHMSMVVVQAESAPFRLENLSDETRAEFASISSSARQALGEIRGLLGVLRHDGDAPPDTTPQPAISDVPGLVETAARSGVPVRLSTHGDLADVRQSVGLAAFRIVQESLANAARHAPGAEVDLTITRAANVLRIDVSNPADSREDADAGDGHGHGIVGMRERAAAVGGTLDAGSSAGGRFTVTATLPLDPGEVS